MASVSCKNKNSLVFHSKYDPVVECCIEAYFLSSMIFYGCDYYVRHSSTNNSTTYDYICVFFKIHLYVNNIVFIQPILIYMKTC